MVHVLPIISLACLDLDFISSLAYLNHDFLSLLAYLEHGLDSSLAYLVLDLVNAHPLLRLRNG